MVISLPAKGLTQREIAAHLAEVYGADVSRQTITTITDQVMHGQNIPDMLSIYQDWLMIVFWYA